MQVITYTPQLLQAAAECLSTQILRNGVHPSYLVAIQHGGAVLGQLMKDAFPEAGYHEIKLTRFFGINKSSLSPIIQALPMKLRDWLRMLEIAVMDMNKKNNHPERYGKVELSISPKAGDTILLIDDAIDTGATIVKARDAILQQYPGVKIVVAVITVTTEQPLCDADFYLYHNQTLCRFPWSMDY